MAEAAKDKSKRPPGRPKGEPAKAPSKPDKVTPEEVANAQKPIATDQPRGGMGYVEERRRPAGQHEDGEVRGFGPSDDDANPYKIYDRETVPDPGQVETPKVDVEYDFREVLQKRVDAHARLIQSRDRDDYRLHRLFAPIMRALVPHGFEVHRVAVPRPERAMYEYEMETLQSYLDAGYLFLEEDMVTKSDSGSARKIFLPEFEVIDGRVAVGGYYALFANKNLIDHVRRRNIHEGESNRDKKKTESALDDYDLDKKARSRINFVHEEFDAQLEHAFGDGESNED